MCGLDISRGRRYYIRMTSETNELKYFYSSTSIHKSVLSANKLDHPAKLNSADSMWWMIHWDLMSNIFLIDCILSHYNSNDVVSVNYWEVWSRSHLLYSLQLLLCHTFLVWYFPNATQPPLQMQSVHFVKRRLKIEIIDFVNLINVGWVRNVVW